MTHRIGEVIDKKRRENGLDRLAEGHGEEKHDGVVVDAAKKLLHGDPVRILVRRSAVIGLDAIFRRSDSKSGIGIKNVNDRLKIWFGEAYGITIESVPDEGTRVIVRMPKKQKE